MVVSLSSHQKLKSVDWTMGLKKVRVRGTVTDFRTHFFIDEVVIADDDGAVIFCYKNVVSTQGL